jgi:hypothetical protein
MPCDDAVLPWAESQVVRDENHSRGTRQMYRSGVDTGAF